MSSGRLRDLRRDSTLRPLVGLVLLTLGLAGLAHTYSAAWPLSSLVIPMVLASLVLPPRVLPWFVTFLLLVLAVLTNTQHDLSTRAALSVASLFVLGLIVLGVSFRRSRLGVAGSTAEDLLVDLRDRIQRQGAIPDLPAGWLLDSWLRSAGGTPFAGDFVVVDSDAATHRLSVAVVDVSGKGIRAGSRSLLLTGAMGGLLGSLPADRFLPAANAYLLRQQWSEGFATAVHVCVDLRSGDFELRSAGHPPALQLHAGSGRWQAMEAAGPILGVVEDAEYAGVAGTLRPGDSLLLYTDGMVESRTADLETGTDRLLGLAGPLLHDGPDGAVRRIVDGVGARDDDRMAVLLHRRD